jgi:hypothetical protein
MARIRRLWSSLVLWFWSLCLAVGVSGCSAESQYRTAVATIDTANAVGAEVYRETWSEPLRAKLEQCDVPEVDTQEAFAECLLPFTESSIRDVLAAVTAWHSAAKAASRVLEHVDPTQPASVRRSAVEVLATAGALVCAVADVAEAVGAPVPAGLGPLAAACD